MRKVILYIAMSLDGYIADPKGGVEWLGGQDAASEDMGSYPEFIQTVDTVIMGWKTYHQVTTELSPDQWVYSGMKSYIITHQKLVATEDIEYTEQPLEELIADLKKQEGKHIWICGGASIVGQLIEKNLIDRYHITMIPTLLGDGIRLFEKSHEELKLKLIGTQSYNGMTDLIYERR
nr:dihydrofolate reductase family protein [uncultured Niameybacter sp.]